MFIIQWILLILINVGCGSLKSTITGVSYDSEMAVFFGLFSSVPLDDVVLCPE
jgi:hypothetical protein